MDDENKEIENAENDRKSKKDDEEGSALAMYMGIGMCLGMSIGMLFDNMTMGMCIGLAIGVAVGSGIDQQKRKNKHD